MNETKNKIMAFLEKGVVVSGESVARALGVSRAVVNKHVAGLRMLGYKIKAVRKSGYTLVAGPSAASYENVERILKNDIPGLRVKNFGEVISTQTRAKSFAEKTSCEWLVVRADTQSAGYGRLRREWNSAPGGLWFSLVLRPQIPPSEAPAFSLVFSLAVRAGIEKSADVACSVKWPNDIVVPAAAGVPRKIAGLLAEIAADQQEIRWLIMGCGVNVANKIPAPLRATAVSLSEISRRRINPAEILAAILVETKKVYGVFLASGFGAFVEEYNRHNILTGREVSVGTLDGIISGVVVGADADGRLVIESGGKKHKVVAGDVTVKKIR